MPRRFGRLGGPYVPETLVPALEEVDRTWREARRDPKFRAEHRRLSRTLGGRPTPLYHARNLSRRGRGAEIWLKREDLLHGGAHKFNNALLWLASYLHRRHVAVRIVPLDDDNFEDTVRAELERHRPKFAAVSCKW